MSVSKVLSMFQQSQLSKRKHVTDDDNNKKSHCFIKPHQAQPKAAVVKHPMSAWHRDWQSRYKQTEIKIGNRRADAVVENNVLEFQHSYIKAEEVDQRVRDYKAHGYIVTWIVDGNSNRGAAKYKKLFNGRYLLHFTQAWLFDQFLTQEWVIIDIGGKLFRFQPSNVKSCMIDVHECLTIDALLENRHPWRKSVV